jgi:hypothetical protein
MSATAELTEFVRSALSAGRSRSEIGSALKEAGWSDREITDALAAYSEVEFSPPVPRPRQRVTARDSFTYAILFTALCFSASYLVSLIHATLDIALPDNADHAYLLTRAEKRIRWAISVLLVAAPVFYWLTVHTNRLIAADASHRRSLVRNWFTYIALFLTALAFFGDASYVIYNFLNGEITLRFLLKALTVAMVAGGVFWFYLEDAKRSVANEN